MIRKIDEPEPTIGLRSRAWGVGVLDDRQTQTKRRQRLLAAGWTEEQLDRLPTPLGLTSVPEIRMSLHCLVMAEVVACRQLYDPSSDKHVRSP